MTVQTADVTAAIAAMLEEGQTPVVTSDVNGDLLGGMTVSLGDMYTDMKDRITHFYITLFRLFFSRNPISYRLYHIAYMPIKNQSHNNMNGPFLVKIGSLGTDKICQN